ncbi:MAG: hypothetical protein ABI688_10440 [Bacteroidota bacterium]
MDLLLMAKDLTRQQERRRSISSASPKERRINCKTSTFNSIITGR